MLNERHNRADPGDGRCSLHEGDCLALMASMDAESIDAVVTDPPYHLTTGKKGGSGPASDNPHSPAGRARATTGFMGKAWDGGGIAHDVRLWREILRVARPGAHLVAFGGTRTFHRLACAIEDAGWEIRDTIMWVYGSGFPKSLDVSRAIDKAAGAERRVLGRRKRPGGPTGMSADKGWHASPGAFDLDDSTVLQTVPATAEAARWSGWGTALKPAWEPVIVARKPLRGTVAANVLAHGTGAINIDRCRIEVEGGRYYAPGDNGHEGKMRCMDFRVGAGKSHSLGRWPANLVHDGSDEVLAVFDKAGIRSSGGWPQCGGSGGISTSGHRGYQRSERIDGDSGSAARFFYAAKASTRERWFFCRDCRDAFPMTDRETHGHGHAGPDGKQTWLHIVSHPTQKPESLMRWLCRLVTPPGGLVLDPFLGSGTTGMAAAAGGFRFLGIEQDTEYLTIARCRLRAAALPLFAESVEASR